MDFQTIEKRLSDQEKSEFVERIKPRNEILDYFLLFVACFLALLILFLTVDSLANYFKAKPDIIKNNVAFKPEINSEVRLTKTYDTQTVFYNPIDDYSAKSLVVYDLESNRTTYSKNSDQETFIASLTKMAITKIVADKYSLNDLRVINQDVIRYNGSTLELKEDQMFTIRDLLKAAVIASSNQSAYALQDPSTSVKEMNQYAKVLRLDHTKFSNPAGFDDDGQNYSTADEVVPFAKLFFANDLLLEFSGTSKSDIFDMTESKRIRINTTNDLVKLGNEYVIGGKTGTTTRAGQNLVLLVEKNKRRYLIVILNSIERYGDAEKVLSRL